MVRLFSRSRRSCNPCKSEIIQATQTAVDVSAQAENKVSNLQEDVIVNTGGIAANRVTAQNALTQAGDALVAAQQARQTAEGVSAVADNAITIATDAQSAVEAVEDELTAIQAKNSQQDTDIRDLQQDYIAQTQQITDLQTGKQDKLTAGAGIVISDGVITATGYSGEVDSALSTTSTNPVTNKAITEAINGKQPVGNYALKSEVTAVASDLADAETTINGHITAADARLTNLEQSLSAVDQRVTANATKNTEQDSTLRGLRVEIDGKQNILSFDTTPTAGSWNAVTSNGVYNALRDAGEKWVQITRAEVQSIITSNTTVPGWTYNVAENLLIQLCTTTTPGGGSTVVYESAAETILLNGTYNNSYSVNNANISFIINGVKIVYMSVDYLLQLAGSNAVDLEAVFYDGGWNATNIPTKKVLNPDEALVSPAFIRVFKKA